MFANRAERPDPDRGIASFLYTMYRGGMTGVAKIKKIPKRLKEFSRKIINPDESATENGWRWVCAFYCLMRIDLEKLLEIRPDKPPAKNKTESEFWDEFLQKIIKPKKSAAYNGWRWLCAINYLVDIRHPKDIRHDLPNEHPLKLDNSRFINLEELAKELKDNLGNPTEIEKIDFSGLDFKEKINFSNFIFPINTDFSNATFSEDVLFNNAIFWETADFEGATFHKETSHSKETAKFRNTVFAKIANFRDATFWGYANFKGAKLKGRAFFQDAVFKHHAPRFYDAIFNNEITWAGIKLPNFGKALVDDYDKIGDKVILITDEKAIKNHKRRIEENQNSYENTAILLKAQNKYHDQHFFFRQEMGCRRWLGSDFNYLIYGLYAIFSDYGYGVGRAFAWWLLNIGVGFYILMRINVHAHSIVDSPIRCSILTSFANAHGFLLFHNGPLKGCYGTFKALTEFSFVWGFQTVVGIPLLFLLLLTLRVRFRLR